jgi:methanogenic corrinoid protein MtbC1
LVGHKLDRLSLFSGLARYMPVHSIQTALRARKSLVVLRKITLLLFIKIPYMINKTQNSFSIQDLEILSGIKAHTIRIWEKRYALLNPIRLNRNIRVYELLDLQKLLNVSLLLQHQAKISQLAKLTDEELSEKAKLISQQSLPTTFHINSLIVSMFSFDDHLFEETYRNQRETSTFKKIVLDTYVPLLNHIGVLWQTNSIKPMQEHFISNLIYQKIALNIAEIDLEKPESNEVNILFLPEGEIHEMGLFFLVYCLKLSGRKTIYLGRDVPMENLNDVSSQFQDIHWICSFTIDRTAEEKNAFVTHMIYLLEDNTHTCSIIGQMWTDYTAPTPSERVHFYAGFNQLDSI